MSAAVCASCGMQLGRKDRAGEVRLSISAKGGRSLSIAGSICSPCAAKIEASPEGAMEVLRAARGYLLVDAVAGQAE